MKTRRKKARQAGLASPRSKTTTPSPYKQDNGIKARQHYDRVLVIVPLFALICLSCFLPSLTPHLLVISIIILAPPHVFFFDPLPTHHRDGLDWHSSKQARFAMEDDDRTVSNKCRVGSGWAWCEGRAAVCLEGRKKLVPGRRRFWFWFCGWFFWRLFWTSNTHITSTVYC